MLELLKESVELTKETRNGCEVYTQGPDYTVKRVAKCKASEGISVAKIPEKETVIISGMYLAAIKRFLEFKDIPYVVLVYGDMQCLFMFLQMYEDNEKDIKDEMYWSLD